MKCLRSAKGCVRGNRIRNATISQELNIQSVVLQAEMYKERWEEHVSVMHKERIPNQALNQAQEVEEVWEDR